ncbi:hypothetical protein HISP_16355 [Haloarcula hispanica N601]|uniref:Uncharacterized protein n=2 Tax=Haloarcula hispanica TaxID=51589 RepID=V5TT18_HALHI|nr:hypothetical protein HAH_4105 [Haloarcula hispanica ATCC 33960]AHB67850.2 hypothetical protein HISP_16355 [Haloarcula hispanica N601]
MTEPTSKARDGSATNSSESPVDEQPIPVVKPPSAFVWQDEVVPVTDVQPEATAECCRLCGDRTADISGEATPTSGGLTKWGEKTACSGSRFAGSVSFRTATTSNRPLRSSTRHTEILATTSWRTIFYHTSNVLFKK